jgi:hypothetical protein
MADNKCSKRLSISDIFTNLLSCSDEDNAVERTIHVYDPKELQSGWGNASCHVKYVTCPTSERRAEQTTKNDLTKKRNKKAKEKEGQGNSCKYDKFKNLGVLSYDVPSWRTIIDPEICTYIQRTHPCSYFTNARLKTNDLKRLTFIDPAGVLDQHLGGFVHRQRGGFQAGFGSNTSLSKDVEVNARRNELQMSLNVFKPLPKEKREFWANDPVTTTVAKPHTLKPLPATSHASSITVMTKDLSPILLPNKCSTIDRKTGRIHHNVLQSQKIKLAPFKRQFTPVKFVQPTRDQKQKLNWLPITTSPCLAKTTGDWPDRG